MKFINILIVISIFFFACSTSDDSAIDNRPITEGIFVTYESSPQTIATWGTPGLPEGSKTETEGYSMHTPYPNPASGHMAINVSIPKLTKVKIWLERARWIQEEEEEFIDPFIMEIYHDTLQSGEHSITLTNGFECGLESTNTLHDGFYRVYLESEEFYYWKDIYILGYFENTPEGLRGFAQEFCRDKD